MWNSGQTSPVTWFVGGKRIVSLLTGAQRYWYQGNHPIYLWNQILLGSKAQAQKWVLTADGRIRWAHDSSYCAQVDPADNLKNRGAIYLNLVRCDGSADQAGWQISSTDKRLRRPNDPAGCVVASHTISGWLAPELYSGWCPGRVLADRQWTLE